MWFFKVSEYTFFQLPYSAHLQIVSTSETYLYCKHMFVIYYKYYKHSGLKPKSIFRKRIKPDTLTVPVSNMEKY